MIFETLLRHCSSDLSWLKEKQLKHEGGGLDPSEVSELIRFASSQIKSNSTYLLGRFKDEFPYYYNLGPDEPDRAEFSRLFRVCQDLVGESSKFDCEIKGVEYDPLRGLD